MNTALKSAAVAVLLFAISHSLRGATKDVMRLEGAKKWIAGSPKGFEALVEALMARQSKSNDE